MMKSKNAAMRDVRRRSGCVNRGQLWQGPGSVLTRAQGRVPYQQLRSAADRYRCRISPRTSDQNAIVARRYLAPGATFFSRFATRWLQAVEKTVLAWLPIWILTLLAAFVRIVSQRSISPLVNLPFYSGLPLWQWREFQETVRQHSSLDF
jgi:hypothetical protein